MQVPDNFGESIPETITATDPSGRFERTDILLGQGAFKRVYKAYDLENGVEVAWNQLTVENLNRRDAQQILSEIQILQSLRNENIINFYHSWIDVSEGKERIYFITELMTSGTLSSYVKRTKGAIKTRVIKQWCRQILNGLRYLHAKSPPIIHRDIKLENCFVNGNNGQVKIGDLGLATFKYRDHVSSVIGTPSFMAPELYDEKYNEKVDLYAFGMCVLEMVTREYPYSECTNPAQIFRKVTQGIKPAALGSIEDEEIRMFIEMCIDHNPETRPSSDELLDHPFLRIEESSPAVVGALVDMEEVGERERVRDRKIENGMTERIERGRDERVKERGRDRKSHKRSLSMPTMFMKNDQYLKMNGNSTMGMNNATMNSMNNSINSINTNSMVERRNRFNDNYSGTLFS
ncbi:kinase-like protein, partial [Rozella allomycis CSF55]